MKRVLLVADDVSVARAAAQRLAEEGACEADATSSVPEAIERLAMGGFDFVVVDRVQDCLVVARKLEEWLSASPKPATILVSTPAAFGLEEHLASANRRVRYLVGAVSNAMEWAAS